MSKKAKGWTPRRRCKCPRCSGLMTMDGRPAFRARAITSVSAIRQAYNSIIAQNFVGNRRTSTSPKHAVEQPLLDQLLGAAGVIGRNATKGK